MPRRHTCWRRCVRRWQHARTHAVLRARLKKAARVAGAVLCFADRCVRVL
jgi:hypothetical protein